LFRHFKIWPTKHFALTQIRLREYEDTIQFLDQRKEISDVVKKIQQHETELRELGVEDYDR